MHREDIDEDLGSAFITPDEPITVGTKGTWKIIYTVGKKGILDGGAIRITIPHGFTCPQSKAFFESGFVTAETARNDIDLSINIMTDIFCRLDPNTGHSGAWGRSVFIRVSGGNLLQGEEINVVYGNSDYYGNEEFSHTGALVREISGHAEFVIAVDYDGSRSAPFSGYARVKNCPKIEVKPAKTAKTKLIIPTTVYKTKKLLAKILNIDKYNNPTSVIESEITLNNKDNNYFSLELNGSIIQSNPVEIYEAEPDYKIYWGDIHGHTIHSDGIGTIEEYYSYAKDISKLDFTAITDHDDIGPRLSDEEWELMKNAVNEFTEPGRMVAFLGHEYRNGKCDMNVYYPEIDGNLYRGTDNPYGDAKILTESIKEFKGMIIPHMHFGADWSGYSPEIYRVMEIYSQHGSAEYRGCSREIPYLTKQVQKSSDNNKDCYFHNALNKGFRVGVTAGSDTHLARPGFSDWTRVCRTYLGGLTAVFATELTKESIWNALWNRRCYATTGNRSILGFSINAAEMGSETQASPDDPRKLVVKCIADGKLQAINIFRSNELWIHEKISGTHVIKEYDDNNRKQSDWYYVRIDLQDGEIIWSSPIWIDV